MRLKPRNDYVKWGLTLLGVILASIIILLILLNLDGFFAALKAGFKIISPITYGAVFAYLLNPIAKKGELFFNWWIERSGMKNPPKKQVGRGFGIIVALIVAALLVYATVSLILPQLLETLKTLAGNLPIYFRSAEAWVLNLLDDNPELNQYVNNILEKIYKYFNGLLQTDFLGNIQSVLLTVTSSVYAVVREVLNMVIGIIVSVYILMSKDKFIAQTKKMVVATFRDETADYLMEIARQTHRIFSGFVIGKLIDSLIIGVLCYLGLAILRMPYQILIATIIGITNVIPFFGPFIGAIPTALLVLFVSPIKCLYFVIFILALQQLDGNVIGPRILGDTVGISGFWVLVSITVAGGLFGFAGMILGVPLFAVIYMLVSDRVSYKLKRKGKTTNTEAYYAIQTVDDLKQGPEELQTQSYEMPPDNSSDNGDT